MISIKNEIHHVPPPKQYFSLKFTVCKKKKCTRGGHLEDIAVCQKAPLRPK